MTIDRYLNVDRYDEEALLDDAIVPLTPEAVVTDDSRAELARVRDELAEVRSAYEQDVEVLGLGGELVEEAAGVRGGQVRAGTASNDETIGPHGLEPPDP